MIIPAALIERLRAARRVVVLTGAGISAESGVPTFREAQTGLWALYDPTQLATPQAFQRQAKLVWNWYKWRFDLMRNVQPNAGHRALVTMSQHLFDLSVITQNVDGLHQLAGSPTVIELHGNLRRTKCFPTGHLYDGWPDDSAAQPPPCPQCGDPMRPDVVWFGESLPREALMTAVQRAMQADLFFSIGTSAQVYPAAALATEAARVGAVVVEINPEATPLTPRADFVLAGAAGIVLPQLVARTFAGQGDGASGTSDRG